MAYCKRLLLLVFCALPFLSVCSSVPIVLTDRIEEFPVTREYVEYLVDSSGRLTLREIVNREKLGAFRRSTEPDLINHSTSSVYWLKFVVRNPGQEAKSWFIEMFDFDIDYISFYYPDSSGFYKAQTTGFLYPFTNRKIRHKNVTFPIVLGPGKAVAVYMKFRSEKLNVLEPVIRSSAKYIWYGLNEYLMFGIMYGLLLLIVFYNLLYFVILQKTYYFYYVLYASSILLFLLAKNGTGFQYIWFNYPSLNHSMKSASLFAASLSMITFFNHFFDLRSRVYSIYVVLSQMFIFRILFFFLQLAYPLNENLALIDLLYVQIVFYFGTKLYRSGMKSTKWFIVAYSILNLFSIIGILEMHTVILSNIFTVYSLNIGIILQFVFMSIGMAETVKEVYIEKNNAQAELIIQYRQNELLKEKVNRELEEKVSERTRELQRTKQELEKHAEENYQMNIALDLANFKLQKHLNTFAKSVVMQTHLDFEAFKKAYPDDFSCMRYLLELKQKNGFCCKMCGNTKAIKGKAKFDMRCAKCNYNESLTANTIFHKIKFSIQKAFYLLYLLSQTKTDVSASELARILELQKITCQNFKNKILDKMAASRKNKSKLPEWEDLILDKDFKSETMEL